jgi:hypothetical protein
MFHVIGLLLLSIHWRSARSGILESYPTRPEDNLAHFLFTKKSCPKKPDITFYCCHLNVARARTLFVQPDPRRGHVRVPSARCREGVPTTHWAEKLCGQRSRHGLRGENQTPCLYRQSNSRRQPVFLLTELFRI